MTFQKGRSKTGGRNAGVPNKKTLARINSLNRILKICEKKLEKDIEDLSAPERVRLWKEMSEYTLPKFARAHIELEQAPQEPLMITREVVHRCWTEEERRRYEE